MRPLLTLLVCAAAFTATGVQAADNKTNSQQEKMAACNKEAGDKKGDERKAFMSTCLSNKPAAPEKKMTQQEKMTACNKDAGDKKGDERKAFMQKCLSKSG
jgi:hypothetical protein